MIFGVPTYTGLECLLPSPSDECHILHIIIYLFHTPCWPGLSRATLLSSPHAPLFLQMHFIQNMVLLWDVGKFTNGSRIWPAQAAGKTVACPFRLQEQVCALIFVVTAWFLGQLVLHWEQLWGWASYSIGVSFSRVRLDDSNLKMSDIPQGSSNGIQECLYPHLQATTGKTHDFNFS